MNDDEAKVFELDPDYEQIILLRKLDELAKDTLANVPSLESYSLLLDSHSTLSVPSDR